MSATIDNLLVRFAVDNVIRSKDDRQEVIARLLTLDRAGKKVPCEYESLVKYALNLYKWMRRDRAIHARVMAYHARMVYALDRDERVWDEVDKRISVERLPKQVQEVVKPIEYGATIQDLAQAHNVSVRTIQRRLAEARELLA
jgi:DNA-binding NarL/FixJ family response regulator